jgi:hypothetical protein
VRDGGYIGGHRLALAFSLSMVVTGVLILAVPSARASSLSLSDLPTWAAVAYGLANFIGGLCAAIGLIRHRPDFESGGMVLLGACQAVAVVTSIAALGFGTALLGIVLRGGLMVGCLSRGYGIAKVGPQ